MSATTPTPPYRVVFRLKPDDEWPSIHYFHGASARKDADKFLDELRAEARPLLECRIDGTWVLAESKRRG